VQVKIVIRKKFLLTFGFLRIRIIKLTRVIHHVEYVVLELLNVRNELAALLRAQPPSYNDCVISPGLILLWSPLHVLSNRNRDSFLGGKAVGGRLGGKAVGGRLGGVVVSVLATGSKGHGFKTGRGDGFLRAIKIHSHRPSGRK
jgi:hypothetical protein